MLFDIQPSVLDVAPSTQWVAGLESLALASSTGRHLVTAPRRTSTALSGHPALSSNSRSVFGGLAGRASDLQSLAARFARKVQVVGSESAPTYVGGVWRVPCESLADGECLPTTVLLTEDVIDAAFYQLLAHAFRVQSGLAPQNMSLVLQNGNGDRTHEALSGYVRLDGAIVVCVVDSDRTNPTAALGATARKCVDVATGDKWRYEVIVLGCHEVENLLPPGFVTECMDHSLVARELHDALVDERVAGAGGCRYLDLKRGVTWKCLRQGRYSGALTTALRGLPQQVGECEMNHPDDWRCLNGLPRCSCFVVAGVGDGLISRVLDRSARESSHWVAKKIAPSLEAIEIGRRVLEWGIADRRRRA